jgi:hypothetical protein
LKGIAQVGAGSLFKTGWRRVLGDQPVSVVVFFTSLMLAGLGKGFF